MTYTDQPILSRDHDSNRREILQIVWESGVSTPPTRGYAPGVAQNALLWARRDVHVRVAAGKQPLKSGKFVPEDSESHDPVIEPGFKLDPGGHITCWSASKGNLDGIPAEAILLENDTPWRCPVRGQRNDSSPLTYAVDVIAAEKGLTPEVVVQVTSANARISIPDMERPGRKREVPFETD